MASPSSPAAEAGSANETPAPEEKKRDKEVVHKTKLIQFLGRTTPIILQNDNGPCPLLAICNVLLLKNVLTLSPDTPEISQEKLLSLVAERLLDANSNINNKDVGYVQNQQQNIADAIDLLPRLATGIDVNIRFGKIGEFEFTPECAIFDLLDIPLYHGWIVDAQDYETAVAIGSKSYNTLVEELVALETQNTETEHTKGSEEECVDFIAATTATLGVPSPCLSRGRSFDDPPVMHPDRHVVGKGDAEEEAKLLRVLSLSESEVSTSSKYIAPNKSEPVSVVGTFKIRGTDESSVPLSHEASTSNNCDDLIDCNLEGRSTEVVLQEDICSSSGTGGSHFVQTAREESEDHDKHHTIQETNADALLRVASVSHDSSGQDCSSATEGPTHVLGDYEHTLKQVSPASEVPLADNMPIASENSCLLTPPPLFASSSGRSLSRNENEGLIPSVDGSEPMYEGEESILESGTSVNQNREPMYEGEVILAEQGGRGLVEACDHTKDKITLREGELIRNFLRNSASQLTVCGLFKLREELKERELGVFFRNNHFNTLFKFEDDLYILATDQGFINQPGIVWEKLNEINGDTMYMTCNFEEFNGENHDRSIWDEQIAQDFLANAAQEDSNYDADLRLARDLQQQEYDQYPLRDQQPAQHQSAGDGSRLIVGPQVPRTSGRHVSHSSKPEKSSKDRCTVM